MYKARNDANMTANRLYDEINTLKHLYLSDINEPNDNELSINIQEAITSNVDETVIISGKNIGPVRRISKSNSSKKYNIFFESYVDYSVMNESFFLFDEFEVWTGGLICLYSKSRYLDFIRENTIAEYIREGKIKHYAINCLNHIVNVATMSEPIITELN